MKRLAYLLPIIFLFALAISACSTEPESNTDSQPGTSPTQPVSPVENSGYLYLRLGNVEDQFHHTFVRVPAACLVDQTACDAVEVISTYPECGIGQNRLHWSPDQSRAILLDTYANCLHKL